MVDDSSSGGDLQTKSKVLSGVKKDMSMCEFLRKEKDTLILTSGDASSSIEQPVTSESATSESVMSSSNEDPASGSKRKAAGVTKPGEESKSEKRQKTDLASSSTG